MNGGPSGFNNAPVTRAFVIASAMFTLSFGIRRASKNLDPAFLRFSPSMMNQQDNRGGISHLNTSSSLDEKDIELIVSNIFSTKFHETIAVERITHHLLQGKILLQIEVSMAPDVLIRDAREVAEEAEKEILKAASDIIQVNFELRLGRPIPKFNCEE